jgi:hypothetical protein
MMLVLSKARLAVEERGTLFSGVEWWQVSMIERI